LIVFLFLCATMFAWSALVNKDTNRSSTYIQPETFMKIAYLFAE